MGWNFGSMGLDLFGHVCISEKKLKWTHFSSWLINFFFRKVKLKKFEKLSDFEVFQSPEAREIKKGIKIVQFL